MERMEEVVPEVDYQSMQQFISNSPWDARAVMNKVAFEVGHLFSGNGECGLLLDETYMQKSGTNSVGVSRQYNGRVGKVENSQVAVFAALAAGERVSLIDTEFYLPKEWAEDPERMKKKGVPVERTEHKTKLELALDIVRRQRHLGIPFDFVAADGLYGQNQAFCRELDDMGEQFVLHIHKDQQIYLQDPQPSVPTKVSGRGRKASKLKTESTPIRVDEFAKSLTNADWSKVIARETTRGPLAVYAYSRQVWLWDGEESEARKWTLYIRRDFDSSDIKYVLSNAVEGTPLLTLVKREMQRYWVERAFEDGKQEVSMADYQTQGWVAWHHHMALVMMAMLFLAQMRMRHSSSVPLLSCADIREMLIQFLPQKKTDKQEVFRQMAQRHDARERAAASKSARKKQKLREAGFLPES